MTTDSPLHALDAKSPANLSREEKLVWILGDLMNAVENYFGAENPKRLGHINSAAIRIIDDVLTSGTETQEPNAPLARRLESALNDASRRAEDAVRITPNSPPKRLPASGWSRQMNAITQTQIGFDEARKAILSGKARSHTLWTLIADEHQRDGYALKPIIWEGTGEYQRVTFDDGRDGFVRLPGKHLPKNTLVQS